MNQMLLALIVVSNLVIILLALLLRLHGSMKFLIQNRRLMIVYLRFYGSTKQAGALRFEHVDFRFSPNYGLALKISILRLLLAQPWASLVQLAVGNRH